MHKVFLPLFALAALIALPASAQKKGDAAKGKEVYEQCGVCHASATDEKKMGPSMKGLYKKTALKNGKKVTDASVAAVINKGGEGMPPFEEILTAGEMANLLAYLKTL
ncbi:MAG: adenylate cyclase [Candidatus Solibacter sp.]|nr:adenylate cyclase [Candidatus Solibacter sp.]